MNVPMVSSAEYAGAISRWCDLHGRTPVVRPDKAKILAEFEAFNAHLSELAARQRANPGLSRPPTQPPTRRTP